MADQDPSPSLTTHLLAALNELQAVQQKTQRDLDAEKTNSRQLQEQLDASHETIAQLREDLHAKPTVADERFAVPLAQKSKHASKQRSSSPNHITPSIFSRGRRNAGIREDVTIPLSSLRMKAGDWKELNLVYSYEHKTVQFVKDQETLINQGMKIQLGSEHAQTVFCSTEGSTALILSGRVDTVSRGRIWLEFSVKDEFDMFLETVNHMNDRAKVRDLEPDKFAHVCKSNETFFVPETKPVDSELKATSHHPNEEQILAARDQSPNLPMSVFQGVEHRVPLDSKARASEKSDVATKIESETDIQKLKDDINRLEREIAVLDRKLQSAKDEVAPTIKTEEDGIKITDDVYKSLEKELQSQKSKKQAQIARLSGRIEDLTSQTIEAGTATRANVTSKRIPAKRKRKF
ncbi:hypothetical protein KCU73_g12334, partial [Aureobasidium melanogenum]